MANLFQLSELNTARLEDAFGEVVESSGAAKDKVERFAERVRQDGRVSINMRTYVLASFVVNGRHLNVYEWAEHQARLSDTDKDRILQEKLGKWYAKRVAFDSFFEGGQGFRYGALNIGGLGVGKFGRFCSVLGESFGSSGPMAYLRGDSLKDYVSDYGAVDAQAIERDVAPHSHRAELATVKHGADAASTTEDEWPRLLCSDPDFVEAIFLDAAGPSEVDRVRVSQSDYDELYWLAFRSYDLGLSEGERALGADFVAIRQAEANERIRIEVL